MKFIHVADEPVLPISFPSPSLSLCVSVFISETEEEEEEEGSEKGGRAAGRQAGRSRIGRGRKRVRRDG